MSHRHIKKAWSPTIAVPRTEALALPTMLDRQREAHAEYKHSPCHIVKVRVCAHVYTQMTYQNRHKRDNLYPVGHLSLLSPEHG